MIKYENYKQHMKISNNNIHRQCYENGKLEFHAKINQMSSRQMQGCQL